MRNRSLKNKSNTIFLNRHDIKLKSLSEKDIIKKGVLVSNKENILEKFDTSCKLYEFLLNHNFDLKKVENSKNPYEFMDNIFNLIHSIQFTDLNVDINHLVDQPLNANINDFTTYHNIELDHTAGFIYVGDENPHYKNIIQYGYKLIHNLGFSTIDSDEYYIENAIEDSIRETLTSLNDELEDDDENKLKEDEIEEQTLEEFIQWDKEHAIYKTELNSIFKKRKPVINYSELPDCLYTWIRLLECLYKSKFNIRHYTKVYKDSLDGLNINIKYTYGFVPSNNPHFNLFLDNHVQMIFENTGNPLLEICTIYEKDYVIIQEQIPLDDIINIIFSFDVENVTFKNLKNYEPDFRKKIQTVESYFSIQR